MFGRGFSQGYMSSDIAHAQWRNTANFNCVALIFSSTVLVQGCTGYTD